MATTAMQAAEENPNDMLVRLRPDKRGVFRTKRYMFEGSLYIAAKGWYLVNPETAKLLKELRHDDHDADSPKLFDVCTRGEAQQMEDEEAEQAERATAGRPNRIAAIQNRRNIDANGLAINSAGGNISAKDLSTAQRAPDGQIMDPDPQGEELRSQPQETAPGIVPVGRVSKGTDSKVPEKGADHADHSDADASVMLDEHGNPTNKIASRLRQKK